MVRERNSTKVCFPTSMSEIEYLRTDSRQYPPPFLSLIPYLLIPFPHSFAIRYYLGLANCIPRPSLVQRRRKAVWRRGRSPVQTFFRRRDDEIPKWGFGRSKQEGRGKGKEDWFLARQELCGEESWEKNIWGDRLVFALRSRKNTDSRICPT